MADTKASALSAVASVAATDQFIDVPSGGQSSKATASQIRQYVGAGLSNASASGTQTGFSADQYLTGSSITIPTAGGWRVGTIYACVFDMTKTAAGIAAFTITVRLGTLGTTADTAILTYAFGAGTAAADVGLFQVTATFKIVGAGGNVSALVSCSHHLAATGLISTGASGFGLLATGAGAINTTTATVIGLSVNGGASFSGTNTSVAASALNI